MKILILLCCFGNITYNSSEAAHDSLKVNQKMILTPGIQPTTDCKEFSSKGELGEEWTY